MMQLDRLTLGRTAKELGFVTDEEHPLSAAGLALLEVIKGMAGI